MADNQHLVKFDTIIVDLDSGPALQFVQQVLEPAKAEDFRITRTLDGIRIRFVVKPEKVLKAKPDADPGSWTDELCQAIDSWAKDQGKMAITAYWMDGQHYIHGTKKTVKKARRRKRS